MSCSAQESARNVLPSSLVSVLWLLRRKRPARDGCPDFSSRTVSEQTPGAGSSPEPRRGVLEVKGRPERTKQAIITGRHGQAGPGAASISSGSLPESTPWAMLFLH